MRVLRTFVICLFLIPVVIPTQTPAAAAIDQRVETLLAKLTLTEKLELLGGEHGFYVHAEPSIHLPELRMADGPLGIRNWGTSTAYPAGIGIAASWDIELAYELGVAIGHDARARGVHILLGPGVNIYRAPFNGRNFEYFGEDPYLASRLAVGWIQGVQSQDVSATVKHFALNNEEYDRRHTSADVDERTLHEIYLPAFEAAVREGEVGAIMDSYNLINGIHASQNGLLNNEIAKQQWGFRGIIMSDWNSVYDGIASANGGLDLEMPSAKYMNAKTLTEALQNRSITIETIDDKVRRILRLAVRMGWLDRMQENANIPKDDPQSNAIALKAALESIVLLKNEDNILPLDRSSICNLAVIGPNADVAVIGGGGSSKVTPFAAPTIIEALRAYPGYRDDEKCRGVVFTRGLPTIQDIFRSTSFTSDGQSGLKQEIYVGDKLDGDATITQIKHLIPNDPLANKSAAGKRSARWSGIYTTMQSGPVILFLQAGNHDSLSLKVNGKQVLEIVKPEGAPVRSIKLDASPAHPLQLELTAILDKTEATVGLGIRPVSEMVSPDALKLAAGADVVLVAAGYDANTEGEGFDRAFSLPGAQDELIRQIAKVNRHTIVTLNAGGSVDTNVWLGQIPALIHLWYPGQEGAPALAKILFGEMSPEGQLPISFERREEDNPTYNSYAPTTDAGTDHPHVKYSEGVFVGYRGYSRTAPLFPFGFGLSYSHFVFSHLNIERKGTATAIVSFDVKNAGSMRAGVAAQVYVSDPSAKVQRPIEELKAFRKIHLDPKESAHLQFILDQRSFSYWSEELHDWKMDPGKFVIAVGSSSVDLPLQREINLGDKNDAIASSSATSMAAVVVPAQHGETFAPSYNGSKEYSLNVDATKIDHSKAGEAWMPWSSHPTRVMEQLAGFAPMIVPTDKYGGRLDKHELATGFYHVTKVNGRWWAIDPDGNYFVNVGLVNVAPGNSDRNKTALKQIFGNEQNWIDKTQAFMRLYGFNSAGAWSAIEMIQHSALQMSHPLSYTINLDIMSEYGKRRGGLRDVPGHKGYPNDAIFVFDPEFERFADEYLKSIDHLKSDANLFGYFSDNEIPMWRSNLEGYLALPKKDPGHQAAKQWMDDHHARSVTDDLKKEFLQYEAERYFAIVSKAIRKHDPNHMYLGCRYTGQQMTDPELFDAIGKYADAVSINYYNQWTPDKDKTAMWTEHSGRPYLVTEWYVKGADSGMPNKSGAGWLVRTQAERGLFYQNFALNLIQLKNCIGWHWFKYQDNDPTNSHAELSNTDANKGIVDYQYHVYGPLAERMRQLNLNIYSLADYFDSRSQ